jgi:hypothetical protein
MDEDDLSAALAAHRSVLTEVEKSLDPSSPLAARVKGLREKFDAIEGLD